MQWKSVGALLLMLFAQLTVSVPPAQASSIYDSYIQQTNQLILHSDDTYYPCYNYQQDWSTSWTRWLYDSDFWSFGGYANSQSEYITAWEQAQTSGGWVITDYYGDPTDLSKGVVPFVVFSPSPLYFDWRPSEGVYVRTSNNSALYRMPIQLFQNEGCSGAVWTPERAMSHAIGNATPGGYIRLFAAGGLISPNYPSGYEGEEVSIKDVDLVAMGDSFSSGEGNPPFEYGTDEGGTSENRCHRSSDAYPRLLQSDPSLDLGPTAFVACSGATTSNVLYGGSGMGGWGEGPQVDALSADTEVVTITIGGNDVGFKEYVVGCVVGLCGPGTNDYATIMSAISDTGFLADLEDTYTTILQEAENARVYVLDYPYMVDPTGADSPSCMFYADMSGAVSVQQALNAVISDAVDNVLATSEDYAGRLVYMPTNYIGSPFEGKHYCTDDPDGSSFDATTFHPNEKGHQDYYEIMSDYLS